MSEELKIEGAGMIKERGDHASFSCVVASRGKSGVDEAERPL